MQIILYFFLLGIALNSFAQSKALVVCQKKVDITIPFYEVRDMDCIYYNKSRFVEKKQTLPNGYFTLNTYDKFSVFEGKVAAFSDKKSPLLDSFNIHVHEKRNSSHLGTTNFIIYLQEKNTKQKEAARLKAIERSLQKQFPAYKLTLTSFRSTHNAKTTFKVNVFSNTGGDEFETTENQTKRFKNMAKEIDTVLDKLIKEHIKKPVQNIKEQIVRSEQNAIKRKQNPNKLHVLKFDIEKLGEYDADKKRFQQVTCMNGVQLQYLGAPVEQARKLRENPTQYQIKVYVFERNMRTPWLPNKDPSAFGFSEIVNKETQQLLIRTFARFEKSNKAHYKYTLYFPRL